ncbi:MAG: hypothetical protein ACD_37C00638G0001 [uncultured bacterium]|nr:MAG: hypothetical protein ACD_37C00638G0001 [uncultured bacterium]
MAIKQPLTIETIQAELRYFFISSFCWIRKIFIPVSVNISSSAKTRLATPNTPNCEGERIRAKIAILKKVMLRVDALRIPIHEIPLRAREV